VQVNHFKKLRQTTTTEKEAQAAKDGLSDFWSDSKAQILKDIVAEVDDGKALSDQLDRAFNENLGELLDNWTTERKKIPKHDPVALHDAAWKLRFTIRRYRRSVNEILKVQEGFRQRLLTALDGLQFALAGQIRDYRQQGYRLF
jgi:flagellar motor switch/type III secretory pathway protein FliN